MKQIIRIAHALSIMFRPFYLPLIGMGALFMFSVLTILPLSYRIMVLILTWLCTVIMPQMLIKLHQKQKEREMTLRHKKLKLRWIPMLHTKEMRLVPYTISILCYFFCYWLLTLVNAHHCIKAILVAALIVQMACALINLRWKISTHTAAIGSFLGGLIAFSCIFYFNPVWWFCVITLIGGVVGTCRMILRQHTLVEVVGGYCVGFVGALVTILLV